MDSWKSKKVQRNMQVRGILFLFYNKILPPSFLPRPKLPSCCLCHIITFSATSWRLLTFSSHKANDVISVNANTDCFYVAVVLPGKRFSMLPLLARYRANKRRLMKRHSVDCAKMTTRGVFKLERLASRLLHQWHVYPSREKLHSALQLPSLSIDRCEE